MAKQSSEKQFIYIFFISILVGSHLSINFWWNQINSAYIHNIPTDMGRTDIIIGKFESSSISNPHFNIDIQEKLNNQFPDILFLPRLFTNSEVSKLNPSTDNKSSIWTCGIYSELEGTLQNSTSLLGRLDMIANPKSNLLPSQYLKSIPWEMCLISKTAAEMLNVTIGDDINVEIGTWSVNLKIASIVENQGRFPDLLSALIIVDIFWLQTYLQVPNLCNVIFGYFLHPELFYNAYSLTSTSQNLKEFSSVALSLIGDEYQIYFPKLQGFSEFSLVSITLMIIQNVTLLIFGIGYYIMFAKLYRGLFTLKMGNLSFSSDIIINNIEFGEKKSRSNIILKKDLLMLHLSALSKTSIGFLIGFLLYLLNYLISSINLRDSFIYSIFWMFSAFLIIPILFYIKDAIYSHLSHQQLIRLKSIFSVFSMNSWKKGLVSICVGIIITTSVIVSMIPAFIYQTDLIKLINILVGLIFFVLIGFACLFYGILSLIEYIIILFTKMSNILYKKNHFAVISILFCLFFMNLTLTQIITQNTRNKFIIEEGADFKIYNQGGVLHGKNINQTFLSSLKSFPEIEIYSEVYMNFNSRAITLNDFLQNSNQLNQNDAYIIKTLQSDSDLTDENIKLTSYITDPGLMNTKLCGVIGINADFPHVIPQEFLAWSEKYPESSSAFSKLFVIPNACIISESIAQLYYLSPLKSNPKLYLLMQNADMTNQSWFELSVVGVANRIPGFINFHSGTLIDGLLPGIMVNSELYFRLIHTMGGNVSSLEIDQILMKLHSDKDPELVLNQFELFLNPLQKEYSFKLTSLSHKLSEINEFSYLLTQPIQGFLLRSLIVSLIYDFMINYPVTSKKVKNRSPLSEGLWRLILLGAYLFSGIILALEIEKFIANSQLLPSIFSLDPFRFLQFPSILFVFNGLGDISDQNL